MPLYSRLLSVATVAILGVSTVVARADTFDVTVTPDDGSASFSFSLSSPPTYVIEGAEFDFTNVPLSLSDGTSYLATVGFSNPSYFISLFESVDDDFDFSYLALENPGESDEYYEDFDYLGPQLYSGTESSPVMLTGTFDLTGADGQPNATITISDSSAVAPELSTLALCGTGLLGLAGTVRRRCFHS
ncbi:MAG TPA: hypothetical protein VHY48_11725 [Acidobacteriaceae bacterium]|jgi:hypothetical protein|nr:hypothetical protein [Acidobacteriaceae bacterium]